MLLKTENSKALAVFLLVYVIVLPMLVFLAVRYLDFSISAAISVYFVLAFIGLWRLRMSLRSWIFVVALIVLFVLQLVSYLIWSDATLGQSIINSAVLTVFVSVMTLLMTKLENKSVEKL